MSRKVKIEWNENGPQVGHLTGTEAKAVLRSVLVDLQREQQIRAQALQVVAGIVWRDAQRGILGADGQPVTPMRLVLGADATTASARPWRVGWERGSDGTLAVTVAEAVDPEAGIGDRDIKPENVIGDVLVANPSITDEQLDKAMSDADATIVDRDLKPENVIEVAEVAS